MTGLMLEQQEPGLSPTSLHGVERPQIAPPITPAALL